MGDGHEQDRETKAPLTYAWKHASHPFSPHMVSNEIVQVEAWLKYYSTPANMSVLSKLERIPSEVLDDIVIFAVESRFLGPPTTVAALMRVSRTMWKALTVSDNFLLYARIFRCKFDVHAPLRRLGDRNMQAAELAGECVRRFQGLQRLRQNTYAPGTNRDSPDGNALDGGLRADLWMAYLMFLENDCKNVQQLLQYARINSFVLEFVRPGGRLHVGAENNMGWTLDTEVNALVLWLFWFTDDERVRSESAAQREDILGALGCLYTGSFKYASLHAPLTSFIIPPVTPPPSPRHQPVLTLSASPLHLPCIIQKYFGHTLVLARPLMIPPAFMACLVRLRGYGYGVRRNANTSVTRAEAIRRGWPGAMGEDFAMYEQQGTSGVEWGGEGSERHEHDWKRLLTCYNPWNHPRVGSRVFTPGQLDGRWEGRWLTVPHDYFQSLLQMTQDGIPIEAPLQPPVYQQPMQFQLKEHHQHDPEKMVRIDDVGLDGMGCGALRAWLPNNAHTVEQQGTLRVCDPEVKTRSTYRTYSSAKATLNQEWPADSSPYSGGVWDIILTAETDEDFAAVWGADRYVGRVREWDGLVVLVREMRPNVGRWVFSGYIHGNQNMVGRWRETGTPVDEPGFQGVWGMVKSSE